MPYEDISIAHVFNYLLADGFDASGETDVLVWLGNGKTLADMLGVEVSQNFYTKERKEELSSFIFFMKIEELPHHLNDDDEKSAVVLTLNSDDELVFSAGNPKGTPAIITDWFKRQRATVRREAGGAGTGRKAETPAGPGDGLR